MNRDKQPVTTKMQDHFRTFDGTTVITKRNFSLLRGKTLQEAPGNLVKTPTVVDSQKRRWSMDVPVSAPPSSPDSGCWSPSSSTEHIEPSGAIDHRRATVAATIVGPLDRSSSLWDWPFGEPKIVNSEDYIEAQFQFCPFLAEEVWADIMGNELMIHCKTESKRLWSGQREIFRCYTLPLNVNPRTAEFSIVQERYLKVVIKKDLPLKLAIAYYGGDLLDESEDGDEDRSDCDVLSSITDDTASV